ncbi:hypothetical protein GM160_05555 [Guyparkeria halophila]|uniref:Uncharacterized protein n=1 Tax=Guyparkeria halophila TaxID=47960 RepID=A0A6I6D4B2_9GAMM|nr:hypothetical protein [Guyparkeria halophila]QGT78404.1 hypothetical protein GM160_05555 [Guyparkeria halophila]
MRVDPITQLRRAESTIEALIAGEAATDLSTDDLMNVLASAKQQVTEAREQFEEGGAE